jgi:hypothetical protein
MMLTRAGHFDREACYEARNEGNRLPLLRRKRFTTFAHPETQSPERDTPVSYLSKLLKT